MLTWPNEATEARTRTQQAYVVPTKCHSYYAYLHAKHTSKKADAQWVASKYPRWDNLSQKASKWSRDKKNKNREDEQNKLQTQQFISFILNEVENKA